MRHFVDDDAGYLAYLKADPDGWVLNTERVPKASYLVLHRASCRSVRWLQSGAKHWTKDYVKHCGGRAELEAWARAETGGGVRVCALCG